MKWRPVAAARRVSATIPNQREWPKGKGECPGRSNQPSAVLSEACSPRRTQRRVGSGNRRSWLSRNEQRRKQKRGMRHQVDVDRRRNRQGQSGTRVLIGLYMAVLLDDFAARQLSELATRVRGRTGGVLRARFDASRVSQGQFLRFSPHLADVFDHRKPAAAEQHHEGEPGAKESGEERTLHGESMTLQTYASLPGLLLQDYPVGLQNFWTQALRDKTNSGSFGETAHFPKSLAGE